MRTKKLSDLVAEGGRKFEDIVEPGSSIWDVKSFACESLPFNTYLEAPSPFTERVRFVGTEDFQVEQTNKGREYNGTQDLDLHTLEALYKMMLDSGRDKDWLGFLIANKKRMSR